MVDVTISSRLSVVEPKQLGALYLNEAQVGLDALVGCITIGEGDKWKELAFSSGTKCKELEQRFFSRAVSSIRHNNSSFAFDDHSCYSKALLAAGWKAESQGTVETSTGTVLLHPDEKFLICRCRTAVPGSIPSLGHLASIAVRSQEVVGERKSSSTSSNLEWYAFWQIGFVVHTFIAKYVVADQQQSCRDRLEAMLSEHTNSSLEKGLLQYVIRTSMSKKHSTLDALTSIATKKATNDFEQKLWGSSSGIDRRQFSTGRTKAKTKSNATAKKSKLQLRVPCANTGHVSYYDENSKSFERKIYEGAPNKTLPGGVEWPLGWKQVTIQRIIGGSQKAKDSYFFSPQTSFRLRSLKDVVRFLGELKKYDGNERKCIEVGGFKAN